MMGLMRKKLMVDAEQRAAQAARRGTSESSAAGEAIETAHFAEEFEAAMDTLEASGYGLDNFAASADGADQPELARRPSQRS